MPFYEMQTHAESHWKCNYFWLLHKFIHRHSNVPKDIFDQPFFVELWDGAGVQVVCC